MTRDEFSEAFTARMNQQIAQEAPGCLVREAMKRAQKREERAALIVGVVCMAVGAVLIGWLLGGL